MNLRQAKKLVNGRCFTKHRKEYTDIVSSITYKWLSCNMFRYKKALTVYLHHLKKGKV